MLKYKEKTLPSPPDPFPSPSLPLDVDPLNPARGSGGALSAPSACGLGWSPGRNRIWRILALKYDIWWQQFFQDLKLQFPGLSRSCNFKEKNSGTFRDFPGGVGTPVNS